jgi:hypothetical protein
VSVPHDPKRRGADGTYPAAITVGGADFISTVIEQSRWSKWASVAAAVTAASQAIALTLPD